MEVRKLFCWYEYVFKCTFSRGKVGPRPLPSRGGGGGGGVVHVKIQTGMLVQFLGFEFWVNPILGGCRKLVLFFEVT